MAPSGPGNNFGFLAEHDLLAMQRAYVKQSVYGFTLDDCFAIPRFGDGGGARQRDKVLPGQLPENCTGAL